jgi:hypothetical protein
VTFSGSPLWRGASLIRRTDWLLPYRALPSGESRQFYPPNNGTIEIFPDALDLDILVSKQKELPLLLLAELSVILSHHSAPIIQPMVYSRVPNEEIDNVFA